MSKVLTFIALSGGCVVPVFMDLGSSHLFNELWDEHARTHLVWMIASFFFIFILGSYFLFIEKNEVIPALMSLCVLLGVCNICPDYKFLWWSFSWRRWHRARTIWHSNKPYSFFIYVILAVACINLNL